MVSPGNIPPDDPHSTPEDEGLEFLHIDPATLGRQVLSLQTQYPRINDNFERVEALNLLKDALPRLASDPAGSNPEYYASVRDQIFYARLKNAADSHQVRGNPEPWPGATIIRHEETTFHWFGSKKTKDPILRDPDGNPIVGYQVGYFNVAQFSTPVMFCSDEMLRMLIKPVGLGAHKGHGKKTHAAHDDYAQRTFSGYCTLPDPNLVYPVLDAGCLYPVSYSHGQSKTLQTDIREISGLDIPY